MNICGLCCGDGKKYEKFRFNEDRRKGRCLFLLPPSPPRHVQKYCYCHFREKGTVAWKGKGPDTNLPIRREATVLKLDPIPPPQIPKKNPLSCPILMCCHPALKTGCAKEEEDLSTFCVNSFSKTHSGWKIILRRVIRQYKQDLVILPVVTKDICVRAKKSAYSFLS